MSIVQRRDANIGEASVQGLTDYYVPHELPVEA